MLVVIYVKITLTYDLMSVFTFFICATKYFLLFYFTDVYENLNGLCREEKFNAKNNIFFLYVILFSNI